MKTDPAISRWIQAGLGIAGILLGIVVAGVPIVVAMQGILAEFGRGETWIIAVGFNDHELTGWQMWGFLGGMFMAGIAFLIGGVWLIREAVRSPE